MPNPRIRILNGPNLNLLGQREPEIYGTDTLAEIDHDCCTYGADHGLDVQCNQSNHEGQLIDWVQECMRDHAGLIINPGGYSHTSIALRDAVAALLIPVVELHLSNIHARDPFRQHSFIAGAATGLICGFGAAGYRLALDAIRSRL